LPSHLHFLKEVSKGIRERQDNPEQECQNERENNPDHKFIKQESKRNDDEESDYAYSLSGYVTDLKSISHHKYKINFHLIPKKNK
jgi:hypothetical protein